MTSPKKISQSALILASGTASAVRARMRNQRPIISETQRSTLLPLSGDMTPLDGFSGMASPSINTTAFSLPKVESAHFANLKSLAAKASGTLITATKGRSRPGSLARGSINVTRAVCAAFFATAATSLSGITKNCRLASVTTGFSPISPNLLGAL